MVQSPLLVGLCGYATSGKDACAEVFVREHGFIRYAFTDSLKTLARDIGWHGAKDDRGRRFLQSLGMAMRELDQNYWINKVARPLLHTRHFAGHPIVVSDVRFRNEAEWIRAHGGLLVRVERRGVGPVNGHESETDLDDVLPDWSIRNNRALADLSSEIADLLALATTTPRRSTHRVYIAGPMTKYAATDWNYPLFNRVAGELRALGHWVWNPVESFDGRTDLARNVYMSRNIEALLGCSAMVLLPEWEDSSGARCEKAIADQLQLKVVTYGDGVTTL